MSFELAELTARLNRGPVLGLLELDGVECAGPDAPSYLQGQVSQDIEALAVGAGAPALLLSPQGKLEALVEVVRSGEESYLCLCEPGRGEAVLERLRRFKIRVRAELREVPLVALVGFSLPEHERSLEDLLGEAAARLDDATGHWSLPLEWRGVRARALVATGERATLRPAELDLCSPEALEYLRIEAGVPRWGRELDESTIAAEAGLVERTVSFSKGCYTGQELVARLDARGSNVARRLYRVAIAPGTAAVVGDRLASGERTLGELTSVAPTPEGGRVALGYFRRGAEVPGEVELVGSSGAYVARVLDPV